MKKTYLKKNNEQGFSLVEFIVVLFIFSIMTSISIFDFYEYRGKIEEVNIAQDIGLTLRQAQVYGLSGSDRIIGRAELEEENNAVNFFGDNELTFSGFEILNITQDRSIRGVAINTQRDELIVFEDNNGDFRYNSTGNSVDRVIDLRGIVSPDVRLVVCLSPSPIDPSDCDEDLLVFNDEELVHILFQRPYPDPYIYYENTQYSYVYIQLANNNYQPINQYIEINPVGNISTKNYEQE